MLIQRVEAVKFARTFMNAHFHAVLSLNDTQGQISISLQIYLIECTPFQT